MTVKKFLVVYKSVEGSPTKVNIFTGWQMDNLIDSKVNQEEIAYISPLGAEYTPEQMHYARKLK